MPQTPGVMGIQPTRTMRLKAEKSAVQTVCGLLQRKLERMESLLTPSVYAYWVDGSNGWNDRKTLLEHLQSREGSAVNVRPRKVVSYTWNEMRLLFPRGVPEAIDRSLGIKKGMLITMALEEVGEAQTSLGRIALGMHFEHGSPKASSLLFPGVDQAQAAGARPSFSEEEAVRIGDKLGRHWLLGHADPLRSLRNHMMHRLFHQGEPRATEEVPAKFAGDRKPKHAAMDLIFQRPELVGTRGLPEALGKVMFQKISKASKKLWFRDLETFRPQLVRQRTSLWRGSEAPEGPTLQLLFLRVVEQKPTGLDAETWRLAGLF